MGCCFSSKTSEDTTPINPYITPTTGSVNGIESSLTTNSILPYIPPEYLTSGEVKLTDTDAILLASNYCKDSPFKWQDEALVKIGIRQYKWNFLVKGIDTESSKSVPMILSMIDIRCCPIPLTNSTTMDVYANLVCGIANPYILSCEDVDYIKDRNILIVIHKFCDRGSLKDLIFGKQNPKDSYNEKYRRDNGRPLRQKIIRTFGRHILEGLSALNSKGIICDNLKTSNVLIDGSVARISDLELTLLGYGIATELLELLTEYEIRRDGRVSKLDVLLFGLVLLEMATGVSYHKKSFQSEIDDNFSERSSLNGQDNGIVREIIRTIFNPNPDEELVTIEGLLSNPYFQDIELTIPSQKLKFQSVEKGLIKSSMNAAAEKRKTLKDELTKIEEKKQQERSQLEKEYEDVTLADEIVNKRRNKSLRRVSNGPTISTTNTNEQTSKVTRRQSALSGNNNNNNNNNSSSNKTKNEENTQTNPIPSSSSSLESPTDDLSMEPQQGIHSSIPPQYQKLLQLGFSQEQVTHKMIADGYDPSLVGW